MPLAEPPRHVAQVDTTFPELERSTVTGLIGPYVFRPAGGVERPGVVAAVEGPQASAAMNAFQAATMSAFSQKAAARPPLAVLDEPHTLIQVRVGWFGPLQFRLPAAVQAITMNRALVLRVRQVRRQRAKRLRGNKHLGESATRQRRNVVNGRRGRGPSSTR